MLILMHLVPDPPGVESDDHSYCNDFGKSLLNNMTNAIILPDFLLMKTIQDIETGHCHMAVVLSEIYFLHLKK